MSWRYDYKPLKKRTQLTIAFLIVQLIIYTLAFCLDKFAFALFTIDNWADPNATSSHPWEAPLLFLLMLLGLIFFVFLVLTIVFVCMWMYRANANARALGAGGISVSPGWCAGWWFIPIASLWMPYRAMKEVYLASERQHWTGNVKTSINPGILKSWWACWLISILLGNVTENFYNTQDPTLISIAIAFDVFLFAITIYCAWLLIQILQRVNRWQGQWCMTHENPDMRQCPQCGYNLRATPGPVCPECGFDLRMNNSFITD